MYFCRQDADASRLCRSSAEEVGRKTWTGSDGADKKADVPTVSLASLCPSLLSPIARRELIDIIALPVAAERCARVAAAARSRGGMAAKATRLLERRQRGQNGQTIHTRALALAFLSAFVRPFIAIERHQNFIRKIWCCILIPHKRIRFVSPYRQSFSALLPRLRS